MSGLVQATAQALAAAPMRRQELVEVEEFAPAEASHARALSLEPREERSGEADVRLLTFTAASDEPYTRALMAGNVREVTDFKGLDQSRLARKRMPLLDTHRNTQLSDVLGRIVDHQIIKRGDSSTALEVTAAFYMDDQHSRAAYEKIMRGLVSNVSIGYTPKWPNGLEIKDYRGKQGFDWDNDIAADVRLVDWEILEVSLVPSPADDSVGIGRAGDLALAKAYKAALAHSKILPTANAPRLRGTDMTDQAQAQQAATKAAPPQPATEEAPATKAAPEDSVKAVAAQMAQALADIKEAKAAQAEATTALAAPAAKAEEPMRTEGAAYLAKNAFALVNAGADEEAISTLAGQALEGKGLTEAQVKAALWDQVQAKDSNALEGTGIGRSPQVQNPEARHNLFDFERMGRALLKGVDHIDGREAEVIQEHASHMRKDKAPGLLTQNHSVIVPFTAYGEDPQMRRLVEGFAPREKRYDVGTSPGAGGATGLHHDVFDETWMTSRLIEGATVLPHINFLPTEQAQDLIGVTEDGGIVTGFLASENAQRTESAGLVFGNRALRWKMAYGRKDFSQRALDQSRFIFGRVIGALRYDLNRRIDQEVLLGLNNTSGGFPGIFYYPNVETIALGANGEKLTFEAITEMIQAVESNNALRNMPKWIMTPRAKAQLRRQPRLPGQGNTGTGDAILNRQVGGGLEIEGYDVITSNVAGLKTFTKGTRDGTGTDNYCEGMVFGDLSSITGAYFSGTEMVVDPYSGLEYGQTRVYIRLALDVQVDHVESFCIIKDINPTLT